MIKLLTLKRRAKEAKSFLPVGSPAVLLIAVFVFKFEDRNFVQGIYLFFFSSLLLLQGSSSVEP